MAKALIKYKVLKEPGAIFGSSLTTEFVELTNNKVVDFIVSTGIGSVANLKLEVVAKLEDGEEVNIPFKEKIGQTTYNNIDKSGKEFEIGGNEDECGFIVLSVDSITLKGLYDRVALKLTGVDGSTVVGVIVAATYDPRYSE